MIILNKPGFTGKLEPMQKPLLSAIKKLQNLVVEALEEVMAQNVVIIDVRGKTTITDVIIVATGTSHRQVKAAARHILDKAATKKVGVLGVEGESPGEWILIDLADIVVHVMLPATREFYQLEKLWKVDLAAASAA